jgi:hypothetical protein
MNVQGRKQGISCYKFVTRPWDTIDFSVLFFDLTHPCLLVMMNFLGELYMTLDPEKLRHAMRAWTTGVAIVTSIYEGQQYGMTVNSFTSISWSRRISVTKGFHTQSVVNQCVFVTTHCAERSFDPFAKLPDIIDRFGANRNHFPGCACVQGGDGLFRLPGGELDAGW